MNWLVDRDSTHPGIPAWTWIFGSDWGRPIPHRVSRCGFHCTRLGELEGWSSPASAVWIASSGNMLDHSAMQSPPASSRLHDPKRKKERPRPEPKEIKVQPKPLGPQSGTERIWSCRPRVGIAVNQVAQKISGQVIEGWHESRRDERPPVARRPNSIDTNPERLLTPRSLIALDCSAPRATGPYAHPAAHCRLLHPRYDSALSPARAPEVVTGCSRPSALPRPAGVHPKVGRAGETASTSPASSATVLRQPRISAKIQARQRPSGSHSEPKEFTWFVIVLLH
jgi:hypothetical protein